MTGFAGDTLVRAALQRLAEAAGVELRLARDDHANGSPSRPVSAAAARTPPPRSGWRTTTLDKPLPAADLHALAASLGADVPFFLAAGPQLGRGDGSELEPLDLPQDFWVVLVLPDGASKESTAAVYERFDERDGADGWEEPARGARAVARRRPPPARPG